MPMRITLDVPGKYPRWATGSNRTKEPPETGPDIPNKDDGHIADYKPPARVQNWLDNLHYQWGRKAAGVIVSNFWPNNEILTASNDIIDAIFHPTFGKFGLLMPDIDRFVSSADAHTFALATLASSTQKTLGIDLLRFIYGDTNGDLYYSSVSPFTSWTQITSATIGGSGTITQIHSKYPDSNKCIITKGTGMRIAATDITGAWSAPTTPPALADYHCVLLYAGNSKWFVITASAAGTPILYISVDDGDTWNGVSTQPYLLSTDESGGLAYSRDTGRLVAVGNVTAGEQIRYTDDNGSSWTSATINKRGLSADMTFKNVYYAGGGIWVACGGVVDGLTGEKAIYVSLDNAKTWFIPDVNQLNNAAETINMNAIACSERNILVVGDLGQSVTSLSMV